jgi:hypothetical protein
MKVTVTAEDIRLGVKRGMCDCPLALALKREGYKNVEVEYDSVELEGRYYNLSLAAQRFIKSFDCGRLRDLTASRTFTLTE